MKRRNERREKKGRQTVQVRTYSGSFHFSYTFFSIIKKSLFFAITSQQKKKCLDTRARRMSTVRNRWIVRWIACQMDGWTGLECSFM